MHDDDARNSDFDRHRAPKSPSEHTVYDDDALATAMENESVRLGYTATISIIVPAEPALPAEPAAPAEPAEPAEPALPADTAPGAAEPGTVTPVTRRTLREAERAREHADEIARGILPIERTGVPAVDGPSSLGFLGTRELRTSEVVTALAVDGAMRDRAVVAADTARSAIAPPILRFELAGSEATSASERVGQSVQLFWLWFASNASVLSLAFGGALFTLGMSLRQAVVSAVVGVALSFIPIGLGTLAGKWSGQPVMIVSRAMFGLIGNVVPASLALVTRLFWGAVLLWLIGASAARVLILGRLEGPFGELQLTILAMALFFVLALIVAFFGYALFARLQLVLAIASAVLILGLVIVTAPSINLPVALSSGDGPVTLVVTGVVLVFSFLGLVWANSSGDLARYQRPRNSGRSSMLAASCGAAVPALVLIAYGALLAASNPATAEALTIAPVDAIAHLLPGWFPIPLGVGIVVSLFSGVVITIYSGAFALQSVGLRLERVWATVIVGALVFAVAVALSVTVSNTTLVFRDVATSCAVPVAAWTGIFAAEMMMRRRPFDAGSLNTRGRLYGDVNWRNLGMLFIATAIGFGFTSATVSWLSWQGYLFAFIGTTPQSPLGESDFGVLIALLLGLLTPFLSGVRSIRRQESLLA